MSNFTVLFEHPWLLLVLIPAIAVTLIPYFRLNKKFRRTRNRIVSVVLHIVVVTLAALVLAHTTFSYDVPKEGNEIILLVDLSASEQPSADKRDDFVNTMLEKCRNNGMSAGVVTFGFDQVYAVELTNDLGSAYEKYVTAPKPDDSASDLSSALSFAKGLFNNPDTGKIVIVSDGKETDGDARMVIRSVLNQKTKIDFINIASDYPGSDVQISDVIYPDYHVKLNEECTVKVVVQATDPADVRIDVFDNDTPAASENFLLTAGDNEVEFRMTFLTDGVHELRFSVDAAVADDGITENDGFTSYYNLQNFNKILVLESYEGESVALEELLGTDELYDVTVMNLFSSPDLPSDVDEFRAYDQVILNNVSNADMDSGKNPNVPDNLVKMLHEYVSVYGGGMMTVGGYDRDGETAHAYNRKDMYNSEYQRMLPVEAIDYTPPLGVVVIIDFSGSMSAEAEGGATRLHWAKVGADICLSALTERDYFGLMTLYDSHDRYYDVLLEMTPRTQDTKIREAIYEIPDDPTGGGTTFSYAIERAGLMLRSVSQIERRRIIIVTDGLPNAGDEERYREKVQEYYEKDGTSVSVVTIGLSGVQKMQDLVDLCKDKDGNTVGKVYKLSDEDASDIGKSMREDIRSKTLKEVNYSTYSPVIKNLLSPLVSGLERDEKEDNKLNVTLDGYFGVKARTGSDTVLAGDYDVPLYTQWKLGNGMVGSFMTDLKGTWSADFMESEVGRQFIYNAVENLMPVTSIRPVDMKISFVEDNYLNTVNVFDALGEGEKITGTIRNISSPADEVVDLGEREKNEDEGAEDDFEADPYVFVRTPFNAGTGYTNCVFVIKKSGVYEITLSRVGADGEVIATMSFNKSFAYSEEYDNFYEDNFGSGLDRMTDLAATAGGKVISDDETISDPQVVFEDFVLKINEVYDPRYLFLIIAIVLFLLDIAVRKFKFKWIHEIIREKRAAKAEENK